MERTVFVLVFVVVNALVALVTFLLTSRELGKEVREAKAKAEHYRRCYEVINSTYNTFLEAFEAQTAFRYNLKNMIEKNLAQFREKKLQYDKDKRKLEKFFCMGAIHALCLVRLSTNPESNPDRGRESY